MKHIFLIPIIFLFTSCSGKISSKNYDKIKEGMTLSEVEAILGKGESQASSSIEMAGFGYHASAQSVVWQSGTRIISIMFYNDRVVTKSQIGLSTGNVAFSVSSDPKAFDPDNAVTTHINEAMTSNSITEFGDEYDDVSPRQHVNGGRSLVFDQPPFPRPPVRPPALSTAFTPKANS
jgi:hypothetical protein